MTFSQEKLAKVNEIIGRYPQGKQKSALIPLLHMAQDENAGWLSVEAMNVPNCLNGRNNFFTIQFQNILEHAVGSGVGRTQIYFGSFLLNASSR